MRRANGDIQNPAFVDLGLSKNFFDCILDAQSYVYCCRGLACGKNTTRFGVEGIDIENCGIGVGSADVNTNSVHL
jgi:hypothetical protein